MIGHLEVVIGNCTVIIPCPDEILTSPPSHMLQYRFAYLGDTNPKPAPVDIKRPPIEAETSSDSHCGDFLSLSLHCWRVAIACTSRRVRCQGSIHCAGPGIGPREGVD
jgi:hypothetical protein